MSSNATTLDMVPPMSRVRIVSVGGGRGVVTRLLQMGIVPGELVEVLVNTGHGPVIIRVRGVTIALGRGVARKIVVEVGGVFR